MRDLGCDLRDWQTCWVIHGFPEDRVLAPGLEPAVVPASLAGAGLPAATDVVIWFAWHDGLRPGASRAALAPSRYAPVGLAEALALRTQRLAPGGAGAEGWWLPLGVDPGGSVLVVELVPDTRRTGPLRRWDPAARAPGAPLARDLREGVLVWMRAVPYWWWDEEAGAWEFRGQRFPAHLLHPLLD